MTALLLRPVGGIIRGLMSPFIGLNRQIISCATGANRNKSFHDIEADDMVEIQTETAYTVLLSRRSNNEGIH